MSGSREYIINFGSLPYGEHEFEFQIDNSFFQKFENSIVQNGEIDALIVVEKKDNMMILDFTMDGKVMVQCDRCLEALEIPVESYDEIVVKFGEEAEEQSENVIVLQLKEYEIDVAQYIFEFITLQIPLRNVHDEEENGQSCDPETLKEMEKYLLKEDTPVDPRWEGLKGINLN